MTTKDEWVQNRLEKTSKRRRDILDAFVSLGSKAAVGRQFGLSRERVSQIIEKELGSRSPIITSPTWMDWPSIKKVVKAYRIRRNEIAKLADVNDSTVSHVLSGNELYIGNRLGRRDVASARILLATLYLIRRRMYYQEKATRGLIDEFTKLKYGYSED